MKCPGQDSRFWKRESVFEVACPGCGAAVEFFKDEPTRVCRACGHKTVNPRMNFGCASHCKYAEACLGDLPLELAAMKNELFKDRLAVEIRRHFKGDFDTVIRIAKTVRYAAYIAGEEKGDPAIAISAASLLEIAIGKGGPSRRQDSAGEKGEGLSAARDILARLGARQELVEGACDILGRLQNPLPDESPTFMAVSDAARIANLEENAEARGLSAGELSALIEKNIKSASGRRMAFDVLSGLNTEFP